MTNDKHSHWETFDRMVSLVRDRRRDQTMVALIIDSPWLPGYAGVGTMDFYFDSATWVRVHQRVLADLPGVAFVPGPWVELGMAAEPSGWGVPIRWSDHQPPGVQHYPGGWAAACAAPTPDPQTDGLMPVILNQYRRLKPRLAELGMPPRIAACRGPLAIASHLVGVTEILMATQLEPDRCEELFDKTTELCIRWLQAQLDCMDEPVGVLVLDDLVGMMGPDDAARFALPRLKRIFEAFGGLVRFFHNDTPNEAVFPGLAAIGIDVFNFSHATDLATARRLLGPDVVLMGNLPPLELVAQGAPEAVREATFHQIEQLADVGPLLISPGGGVSPGTPIENLQAMQACLL